MPPTTASQRPAFVVADDPRGDRVRHAVSELAVLAAVVAAVAVGVAFPFRPVKYGLVALLAVVLLVQTLRRPPLALALLILASPGKDLVPAEALGIRALNGETVLLAWGLLIWMRMTRLHGQDRMGPPLGRVLLVYGAVIVAAAVNAWLTFHHGLFDILAAAKNHLTFMVFVPIAFHVARERRDQWLLVIATSLALLLTSLQGIQGSWLAFVAGTLERHRATSLLAQQPNIFGSALAMYLPLLCVFALNRTAPKASRTWFAVCAGAAAMALLLTLSRGSWMGAAGGLAVAALFRDRKLLVLLSLAVATYGFWVPQAAIDRVEVTTRTENQEMVDDQVAEDSTQMRIEQYKSLPAMMRPRPVFGWGYRTYPLVFERYGTLGRPKGAHSSYCQLGTEAGVIGLVTLAAVLAAMAWTGVAAARVTTDPFHRWLGVALLGGTVAMAICMASGARFEPQKMFIFFWCLAGVAQRETVLALARRRALARHVPQPMRGDVTRRPPVEDRA